MLSSFGCHVDLNPSSQHPMNLEFVGIVSVTLIPPICDFVEVIFDTIRVGILWLSLGLYLCENEMK